MNVSPSVWGEYYWFVYYTTALTYSDNPTDEEKKNVKELLLSLSKNLPCDKCNENFKDHVKKYPLNNETLKNRTSLLEWVVNINNEVNISTKSKLVTLDEMRQKYLMLYNKKKINKNYSHFKYTISIILILFMIVVLIKLFY